MRFSPYTPIFDPRIRKGGVRVGAMIGAPPTTFVYPSTIASPVSVLSPTIPIAPSTLTVPASVPTATAIVPSGFVIIGSVTDTLLDGATNLVQSGNYCYVTCAAQDRMTVVDVSNTASPSVVGSYTSSTNIDNPQRIAKSGNYVFVTSSALDSLASIDVSTPGSPALGQKLTNATKLDGAVGVAIQGNYAYVAAGGTAGRRLVVIDISNPLSMSIVGDTGSADFTNFGSARGVTVSGNYAYVCSNFSNRLTVVDVSNPASPLVVASVQDNTKLDGASYVLKDGNYLYVASQDLGYMTIIDVTTPTSPVIKDGKQYGERGICKIGNSIFTTNAGDEIDHVDVSNVNSITGSAFISSGTFLNGCNDLATDGSHIFCAAALADRLTILVYYP